MKKKWVVVAESSRARIFSVESRTSPLKEVDDLINSASRLKGEELVSDDVGRSFDSHGHGGRHAMEPRTQPKETEVLHFAHDVGEAVLDRGALECAFADLIEKCLVLEGQAPTFAHELGALVSAPLAATSREPQGRTQ